MAGKPETPGEPAGTTCARKWTMWLAAVGLLFGFIGIGLYNLYLHDALRQKNSLLQQSIDGVRNSIDVLEKIAQEQSLKNEETQKSFLSQLQTVELNILALSEKQNDIQAAIDRLETDGKKTNDDVENLKETIVSQRKEIKELYAKARYSFDVLTQNSLSPAPSPDNQPARSYSYFESPEWEQRVKNFLIRNPSSLKIRIGYDSGKPLAYIGEGGVFMVDGILYKGISGFNLANSLPNVIDVTSPGLASLEGDVLTIRGDAGLDSVSLDGCLTWENSNDTGSFAVWHGIDSEGVRKTVEISAGLPVQAEPFCDNRYLDRKRIHSIAEVWRHIPGEAEVPARYQPGTSRLLARPVFGGIGIRTSKSDNGLRIEEVLPGSPAEKAGLYVGDTILKIDGKPVSQMSAPESIEAIRGVPGTSLTLGYAPSGSINTVKDITLIREIIDSRNKF